jgi:hypothetical protein
VSKALLAALIFAACGLVFLAVTGYMYYSSSDAAQTAAAQWKSTEELRGDLLNKQNELTASGYVATPPGADDIPTILGKLRKDCNIDETSIKYTPQGGGAGAKANQGERYSVAIDRLSLIDLGKFLGKMRASYPYLKVSDVQADILAGSSGMCKWTLRVESMSPGKGGGEITAAPPAERPGTSAEAAETPASSGTSAETAETPASSGAAAKTAETPASAGAAAKAPAAARPPRATSGVKAKP